MKVLRTRGTITCSAMIMMQIDMTMPAVQMRYINSIAKLWATLYLRVVPELETKSRIIFCCILGLC